MIPHITNEIKERIQRLAQQSSAEVVIIEIGGTVGDIEGLPFLEAIRQMRTRSRPPECALSSTSPCCRISAPRAR